MTDPVHVRVLRLLLWLFPTSFLGQRDRGGCLMLCAALAASWLPARRAGRTDPMTSLRST